MTCSFHLFSWLRRQATHNKGKELSLEFPPMDARPKRATDRSYSISPSFRLLPWQRNSCYCPVQKRPETVPQTANAQRLIVVRFDSHGKPLGSAPTLPRNKFSTRWASEMTDRPGSKFQDIASSGFHQGPLNSTSQEDFQKGPFSSQGVHEAAHRPRQRPSRPKGSDFRQGAGPGVGLQLSLGRPGLSHHPKTGWGSKRVVFVFLFFGFIPSHGNLGIWLC